MGQKSVQGIYPEAAWRPSPLEPPVYAQCDISMVSLRRVHGLQDRSRQNEKAFSAQCMCWEQHIGIILVGGGAYDDHYFSFEGEETLEVLELSLRFCLGSHDMRCQLKSMASSIQMDRKRFRVEEE